MTAIGFLLFFIGSFLAIGVEHYLYNKFIDILSAFLFFGGIVLMIVGITKYLWVAMP